MIEISQLNNNSSNFLESAFNQEDFSDFQIRFEPSDNRLYVHKVILAQGSSFFRACLRSPMVESLENVMTIHTCSPGVVMTTDDDDVNSSIGSGSEQTTIHHINHNHNDNSSYDNEQLFTEMIRSLYTGRVTLNEQSQLVPMLKMAGKYGIEPLEHELATYLSEHLSDENLLDCYTLDTHSPKLQKLFQRVQIRASGQALFLLASNRILQLNYQVIHQLLSHVASVSLLSLCLDTIVRWIEYDEVNRAQYSFQLTKLVNEMTRGHNNNRKSNNRTQLMLSPSTSSSSLSDVSSNSSHTPRSSVFGRLATRNNGGSSSSDSSTVFGRSRTSMS